jgi:hypothetical protein
MGRYAVGFLIPKDANRVLGDDGWEFESDSRVPLSIETLLSSVFSLRESASGYSSYEGSKIRADVFKDKNGEIENIYFRFYESVPPELPDFLKVDEYSKNLEFFVP